ncbi:cocosin 1-like [Aristolochia californica]|uniref:cocosin 1-like n=1 Tax=Aristolochia californica TaxID=171875 RepID=UPI0035D931F4
MDRDCLSHRLCNILHRSPCLRISMARAILAALSVLLLCGVSLAQLDQPLPWTQSPPQGRFRVQSQCRLENLRALEPTERFDAEAGLIEYFAENDEQLECAGVAVRRTTVASRGLLLPEYSNAPKLVYILQGRGYTGALIPGCPESFQSVQRQSQQTEERGSERYRDQHQKIREFREGDILALPAGVAYWCYNDGETPVIAIELFDTSNNVNQLDENLRKFQLAGNPRRQSSWAATQQEEKQNKNLFSGFDLSLLAEVLGVNIETARNIRGENDNRGSIVFVEGGLRLAIPSATREEEEEQQRGSNGLEETLCNTRLRYNIADPRRADVYSPKGGRITSINSQKVPILNFLQLNAEKGVLQRNAIFAPHWNTNAHSVLYGTRGNARIQIVGNYGRPVYDGELRQNQLITIPQNFAVMAQAGDQGFEYISFKTSDNAMMSPIVGKGSVINAIPESVLMNSYRLSRAEVRRLKDNRRYELGVFEPSQSRGSASA